MGWMGKFFEKMGVVTTEQVSSPLELVHVYELNDWLEQIVQDKIEQHNLQEHATSYVHAIKDKHWLLDSKLESLPRSNEAYLYFREVKKLLEPWKKMDSPTAKRILELHAETEPQLERYYSKLDQLTAENKALSPFVSIVQDLRAVKDSFEQKITQSGMRSLHNLIQKAQQIEQHTETLAQLQETLQRKNEKLKLVVEKREEKEAELRQLQENPLYGNITHIRDQRTKLMQDIDKADNASWRTDLRQQLEALERSTGNRGFVLKIDDVEYRLTHFREQEQRLLAELAFVQEETNDHLALRNRQIELFANLVKISLGKEMNVKV